MEFLRCFEALDWTNTCKGCRSSKGATTKELEVQKMIDMIKIQEHVWLALS